MPPPPAHLQTPLGEGSDPEFSDDENVPLSQDIYGGSRRSMQETKAWDVFRTLPPSTSSLSEDSKNFLELTIKCLKVFTYLLTFGVVLASGVITKGLVLLMTSQLRKSKKLSYCGRKGGLICSGMPFKLCGADLVTRVVAISSEDSDALPAMLRGGNHRHANTHKVTGTTAEPPQKRFPLIA
ncbi:hypothetical protein GWK47_042889 [Chionoecetes opilio]|uniref:Uncharacterized protein n=1 Tax=Chionoecetes opilio TaxID=41210 RepID=A0A8J4YMI9_CHIOP|nr:hypothetical protein GWK47_042889 [Chionoecetes opilio]